ncbi:MAG: 2-oxo-4-hydroxy-4-carboxy-5-ureidoimidazoline decarboxylase [Gammaproteobacteria bacterium]|jgi:2-oxo-4-hydroxy-4-carboxy-5-ureidoimidazoline decarboxylase|nr:2-oxo-4-hydroxy-4-carboxy-5-ureidoimidazoline decarboxylase [Gammaproteobacteria bacterium]MBT3722169.1 2-oxo-4-hydroxy-4-carboxy-5-ureidoimidazoline decarboxylase [Gammaproteobacteria bacterium]MBT4195001.1 2-oxo-4-hydroxy-4-carboxy-5-ureidoimidazoline decarboxylase [Gammaproteobacteria bacterium]MBT4449557.1 2-oxo-4-hydroxy-4-carboxy-5-ureidoimidazoline decarboxylase [Gammaproteobacteria bacterium]MBT4860566.1 2-oxo-4-hydroxy-4-carboxy-5-ureidoimidazoline decarboxylase [Gammaproteobacteria
MTNTISLQSINNFSQSNFVMELGSIFEHSAWVAEQVYPLRPFDSVQRLHTLMKDIVNNADKEQRKKLICNHPELAGKEAEAGELTADSKNEQAGAGLNNCSAEELQKLRKLNRQYLEKFDFPFVIAVKKLTRYDILDAIETRLQNSVDTEFDSCITEIAKIAEFRLNQLITND